MVKLGSLFDGSGGFPLAGALCGIEPVWASEIEAYPIAVTTQRFPRMKHLGDITKIDGGKIEPVDVITFGSPCQDLSVAGKRAGIHEGARSSLFFHAVRIMKEMRKATNGLYPRIVIWENVHGAFSSNKGEDFRAVLKALCEIADGGADVPRPPKGKWGGAGAIVGDGYSVAWRTYDAQYWGVPQRRRRIYLVADLGSERAGEILFEQEGVRGNSAQGITQGQETAVHAAGSAGRGDGAGGDVTCYAIGSYASNAWKSPNPESGVYVTEVAKTLDLNGGNPSCNQGETCVVALDCRNMVENVELSGTLQAKNEGGFSLNFVNPVVYDARGNGDGGGGTNVDR